MLKYIIVLAALAATAESASATPGAVNASGCHSRPRHCHNSSELNKFSNGRRYVPGAFFHKDR